MESEAKLTEVTIAGMGISSDVRTSVTAQFLMAVVL